MNDTVMQILLVEDNPGDAALLKLALAEVGNGRFHIAHVERLAEAEARLGQGGFDAVLLDLSLPDAYGLDAVIRVRAAVRETPLVVLTGLDDQDIAAQALRAGAQDYIVKGEFDGPLLERALRYAVERQQATAELEGTKCQLEEEVTERRQAEEALREGTRCLSNQNRTLVALTRGEGVQQGNVEIVIREATEAAARTLEVPRVSVWLSTSGSQLWCVDEYNAGALYESSWGRHARDTHRDDAWSSTLLRALQEDRTIAATDAEMDPRTSEFWRNHLMPLGITSVLIAPIRPGGQLVGFVCHGYSGRCRQWRLEEAQFAASLGDLISGVIERSKRHRAEERLRRAQEHLQTVVANAPVACFALDTNGVFTLAEGKALGALHAAPEDLLGASVFEVFADAPEMIEGARHAFAGEASTWRTEIGGRTFEVSFVPVFGQDGGVGGLIGVATEVTALARAEAEQRDLAARIHAAQKLGSLDRLAGGIAQQFRAMLGTILRHTRAALLQLPEGSEAWWNVRHIHIGAVRAVGLARQLLTYTGEARVASLEVSVTAIVEEIGRTLEVWVPKKATLEFDLRDDLPAIPADPSQLRQVILNLVANASEALPGGTGRITITAGLVNADGAYLTEANPNHGLPGGRYVHIDVSDTGAGMDSEAKARMFEPFFTTKGPGRGLGLAAVLGIIRAHGGAVLVDSVPGEGTVVRVLLPCEGTHVQAGDRLTSGPEDGLGAPRLSTGTPLLTLADPIDVEDDADMDQRPPDGLLH